MGLCWPHGQTASLQALFMCPHPLCIPMAQATATGSWASANAPGAGMVSMGSHEVLRLVSCLQMVVALKATQQMDRVPPPSVGLLAQH